MIVPSIDLRNGNAVQLVGGREQKIDAGDPRPIADRFARVGEIAVIDLDVHQGDGVAALVKADPTILAFSIHGRNNLPYRKERSDHNV